MYDITTYLVIDQRNAQILVL